MLVSGYNNVKIGRDVRKGRLFRGYYIYTLSFEERASCPRSCYHWDTCYGNNMPFAKRVDHRDFEHLALALIANVDYLDSKIDMSQTNLSTHPRKGVLVRLHALGDFFSVPYVRLWAGLLRVYPRLACFGYTAWMPETEIGAEIAAVKEEFGRRFAIRWSGREGADGTVTYNSKCPDTVIACPEQTDRTACCATCALCWETDKPIGFKQH